MLTIDIIPATETGKLKVMHLKRYWNKAILKRDRKLADDAFQDEWKTDVTLLNVLGLGLEQTILFVYREAPSFEQFEDWVLEINGGSLDQEKIEQFNRLVNGENAAQQAEAEQSNILTAEDLMFWEENGYVIIREAVSREDCDKTIVALCDFISVDRDDPATWYKEHPARQGIMVQLFQHPALEKNRKAYKIRKAFEELWGRTDIWVNTDRVGFNPPETASCPFQGPRLHWDVSIKPPVPFGTQGILYLADTAESQGAFTLVPGFQHKLENWMNSLPSGENPRRQDLYALGPKPIAANAGDMIIWHQALPHGSSPNTSALPRFVQYINYEPSDVKESDVWI